MLEQQQMEEGAERAERESPNPEFSGDQGVEDKMILPAE